MRRGIRALMVVPQMQNGGGALYDDEKVRAWIASESPDLVVFPEGWASPEASPKRRSLAELRRLAITCVREWGESLGVPVLSGVWIPDVEGERGMQCAAYWHTSPRRGETQSHFYAKHSTSQVLPYSLPDYAAERDALFEPIRLAGSRIGVELCHDQFFGLVSEKWVRSGAAILFDLTGTSVVESKWRNVMAGRSLEHHVPFFCTMTRGNARNANKGFAAAYRSGAQVRPIKQSASSQLGDLILMDSDGPAMPLDAQQAFSPSDSDDVTLTLHPTRSAHGDVTVGFDGVSGLAFGRWHDRDDLGLLVLPAASLREPLCIHQHESGLRVSSRNIVCFVSKNDDLTADEAIVLARLRAIEHRVAIVICTPWVREVFKTSRYKNIQRIRERGAIFGLDGAFMKGTYASMAGTARAGIPEEHQRAYGSLLSDLTAQKQGVPRRRAQAQR
ncbi:nitrilase-related carbon-nitrogen hydrolase [Sorangium sp. So ce429]